MSKADDLRELLDEIDDILEDYSPGELRPERIVKDIIAERAAQRPVLERAVELATGGLDHYPLNPELLRRRAWARCRIVTPDGLYPELEAAERDLRLILELDPDNLAVAFDLLDEMFTFSGMADADVAEVSGELAERAAKLLVRLRALQIRALGYAGRHDEAAKLYDESIGMFPLSEDLKSAKADADSINPTDGEGERNEA